MVIAHNLSAMNTNRQMKVVGINVADSAEKLSSGYRINRAADDAAGLSISEKMRQQIRGLNRGADNISEGIGYCKTADGALQEMEEMCQRINQLAVQAANGTNSKTDRTFINEEIQQLKEEIDRICVTTKYNDEYIFKCEDEYENDFQSSYKLKFSGYPTDVQIYNETYDAATGTATYGGIVYHSVRYAWATISPNMYDAATGLFRKGEYSFRAPDGTTLSFSCEDGSEPPQVTREYTMTASNSGISINGSGISWNEVKTASGAVFNPDNIKTVPYYFEHNGVTYSFTPDDGDDFENVVSKLSYIRMKSTYQIPHEDTAVYMNNRDSKAYIKDSNQIKNEILKQDVLGYYYILHAGDGTSGTSDGVWLERSDLPGQLGKLTSWNDLSMGNWGDGSTDINENRNPNYMYYYDPDDAQNIDEMQIKFDYWIINELSKDTMIDALDGMEFKSSGQIQVNNKADMTVANSDRVVGSEIVRNTIDFTAEEEYELGRVFNDKQNVFGNEQLVYDKTGNIFQVSYQGTDINGNQVDYVYKTDDMSSAVDDLTRKIYDTGIQNYLDLIRLRYLAGASNPTELNLASLIGGGQLTGAGSTTYLEETVTIDPNDTNIKMTTGRGTIITPTTFASAKLDFSGLGTTYNLNDLMGLGFNSTCETCDNHYSIEFTMPAATAGTWSTCTAEDGETYQYSMQRSGNDYTLYIDLQSMQGKITDGTELSNAMIDIIHASGFDFHYTQYATNKNDAVLYLYDNRPTYADTGTSSATNAKFEPFSYLLKPVVDVNVNLFSEQDAADYLFMKYQYNYSDLLDVSNLNLTVHNDANGKYVEVSSGNYELFDSSNAAHTGKQRVDITGVTLNKNRDEVKSYITDEMFKNIADASNVQLKATDYAYIRLSANLNTNKAMVTDFDTPVQVMVNWKQKHNMESQEELRIQCSANSKDLLFIKKQKLSAYRLGIRKLRVTTQNSATKAIDLISDAIQKISTIRSEFGAYQNRLEHAYAINENTHENTQSAESQIRDTDMAEEMVRYSNNNVLQQAGQAMLAQANQANQGILSLLQ